MVHDEHAGRQFAAAIGRIEAHVARIEAEYNPELAVSRQTSRDARALHLARPLARSGTKPEDDQRAEDLRARYAIGRLYWYRAIAFPRFGGRTFRKAAVRELTPCFIADMHPLPEPLLERLAQAAIPGALAELHGLDSADLEQLSAWIALWRRIVAASGTGSAFRAGMLSNLAALLTARFERTRSAADIDEAINAARRAVSMTPPRSRAMVAFLGTLGSALAARYLESGAGAGTDGIDEAVIVLRRLETRIRRHDPRYADAMSSLGMALIIRYDQAGSVEDLDDGLMSLRWAVRAALRLDDHPGLAKFRSNLAIALFRRYQLKGDERDVASALEHSAAAVRDTPEGDRSWLTARIVFAGLLADQFRRAGDRSCLDESIEVLREIAAKAPAGHPDLVRAVANLANVLLLRFDVVGSAEDIDAAVLAGRIAAASVPAGQPDRARLLGNLCFILQARYQRTKSVQDLDEAVTAGRQAVDATEPGHPAAAMLMTGLSTALCSRVLATGAVPDITAAVATARDALRLADPGNVDYPGILSNFAQVMSVSFEHTRALADLDEAAGALRNAVARLPDAHPFLPAALNNLARVLWARFEATDSESDAGECVRLLTRISEVATTWPLLRACSANAAASMLTGLDVGDCDEEALRLYERAIGLLPMITPRALRRADQQLALGKLVNLAANAAAAALTNPGRHIPGSGQAADALALLEAGRGILLSQALDTRNDLTELAEVHPAVADRYRRIRADLDEPPCSPNPLESPDLGAMALDLERVGGDRRRLATDFAALVEEIRCLAGFERFMLAPSRHELASQAEAGPIVALNVGEVRSDAILLTRDGATSIRLPELDAAELANRATAFHLALRDRDEETLAETLRWLWDVAAADVLEALGYRCRPAEGGPWPRVWWLPVGLLGLLPIHAAGYHGDPGHASQPAPTVLDRVISSYTPTIKTLQYARTREWAAADPIRSLIVAMPTTPGRAANLPGAAAEAKALLTELPGASLLAEPPVPDGIDPASVAGRPTKDEVLRLLPGHAIVHFACHATTYAGDPSRSRLLLHDYREHPFSVNSLSAVRLDGARLAFLSACGTAVNPATELADEAIHLTSAFQLAGFPHVVGTLWEIGDLAAKDVAQEFYRGLRGADGQLDVNRSAEVLHSITRQARDQLTTQPSVWASHIHVGI